MFSGAGAGVGPHRAGRLAEPRTTYRRL